MAVVIKGSGSIEGSSGLEMGANGATEIRGRVNVALGSSVAGDSYTSGISTASNFTPSLVPTSYRNLIINGDMQVAQRATSSTTNGYGDVDRWQHEYGTVNENPTFAQHALTSGDAGPWEEGFRYSLHITNGNQTSGLQAASQIVPMQAIEAQNIAQSGWNYNSTTSYITLSFWVQASVAQNYYGMVKTADGSNYHFPFETGTLSANTWKKVKVKVPGNANLTINNDNGAGLQIFICQIYGTDYTSSSVTLNAWAAWSSSGRSPDQTSTWFTTNDSTLEFTGVQLEVGEVATPFEHRGKATELLRCQRYLQVLTSGDDDNYFGTGYYYNSSNAYLQYRMQPEMRTGPSVVQVNGTNYYYLYRDGAGDGFDSFTGFQWNSGTANAGRSGAFYNNTAMSGTAGQTGGFYAASDNAKISLDAEL